MTPQKIPPIETSRLQLVSMSAKFLNLIIEENLDAAGAIEPISFPLNPALPNTFWIKRRLEMIQNDPLQHPWLNRAIVRRDDHLMVGHISFHHKAPDPDLLEHSEFAAELGYTIAPDFRRKGYARESALAMMTWAYEKKGVSTFILSIRPSNIASIKMAESMNFKKIGERMDDTDGLELTMKAEIEDIMERRY